MTERRREKVAQLVQALIEIRDLLAVHGCVTSGCTCGLSKAHGIANLALAYSQEAMPGTIVGETRVEGTVVSFTAECGCGNKSSGSYDFARDIDKALAYPPEEVEPPDPARLKSCDECGQPSGWHKVSCSRSYMGREKQIVNELRGTDEAARLMETGARAHDAARLPDSAPPAGVVGAEPFAVCGVQFDVEGLRCRCTLPAGHRAHGYEHHHDVARQITSRPPRRRCACGGHVVLGSDPICEECGGTGFLRD